MKWRFYLFRSITLRSGSVSLFSWVCTLNGCTLCFHCVCIDTGPRRVCTLLSPHNCLNARMHHHVFAKLAIRKKKSTHKMNWKQTPFHYLYILNTRLYFGHVKLDNCLLAYLNDPYLNRPHAHIPCPDNHVWSDRGDPAGGSTPLIRHSKLAYLFSNGWFGTKSLACAQTGNMASAIHPQHR